MAKKIDYEMVKRLYNPNISIVENCESMGICPHSLRAWLKANKMQMPERPRKYSEEEFMKYYNLGMNDSEIARALGVDSALIWGFRTRRDLESHNPRSNALKGYVPREEDKFWKQDPESLFCRKEFLLKLKAGEVEL
jgi:hypothetical protein